MRQFVRGSFTVEAAFLFPMGLAIVVLLGYFGIRQQNQAVLQENADYLAVSLGKDDSITQEQQNEQIADGLIGVSSVSVMSESSLGQVTVQAECTLAGSIPGITRLFQIERVNGSQASAAVIRLHPAKAMRTYRMIHEVVEKWK
jgi:hypothetical protein